MSVYKGQSDINEKLEKIYDTFDMAELKNLLKQVKTVIAHNNLLDAWLLARPNDKKKFSEDRELKSLVLSANGKWLQPTIEYPEFVVIAVDNCNEETLLLRITHELQHILSFKKSIRKNSSIIITPPPYLGFVGWSEFKSVYTETLLELYLAKKNGERNMFKKQAEILGYRSADSLEGIIRSEINHNMHDVIYFISRYLGAQRAVRNYSETEGEGASSFHLWHLTPTTITEKYGYVFYIANVWEEMEEHDLYDCKDIEDILKKMNVK